MAPFRVILTPAAQRQLDKLRDIELSALRGVILALGDEPRPPGVAKLKGSRDLFRLRLRIDGRPWRVVYQVRAADRQVVVTRVAARDEGTYRELHRR